MQEYAFSLSRALGNGLVPDDLLPPGADYAAKMSNLKPETVATAPELISNPARLALDWPFPKCVRDEKVSLVLSRTGLSTLTEASPSWTVSSQVLKSSFSQSTTVTLAGGTHWDFCAFEDGHFFATNGVDFAFKLTSYSPYLKGYLDASTTPLTVKCLCRHGERLLLAGVSGGTWFTDTRFQALFDLHRLKQRQLGYASQPFSDKFVIWGERRGGAPDGPFFLLMCALGLFGTSIYDTFEPEIRQAVENGEIGFASVKDVGVPRQIKALANSVLVYGPSALCTLTQQQNALYGAEYDTGRGIRSFALSGDASEHAWIDPGGFLHHSRHGLLNFRWIFQNTPSSTDWATPVMSYDPQRREHWISNGTDTYVLTADGKLGGPMTFTPTGLFRSDALLVGVTQYNAGSGAEAYTLSAIPTATTWTAEFKSHTHDMRYRGSKRVQVVECAYYGLTSLLADVHARATQSMTMMSMGTTPFNPEAAAFVRRSGNDFQFTVKGTVNAGSRYAIQRVDARYQAEGLGNRRGTNAPDESS